MKCQRSSCHPRIKYTVGLHLQQVAPVDAGKVVMLLDLEGAPGTQPVQGALLQQQGYHVLGLGLHWPVVLLRPLDSVMDRVCERVLRRLACIILTNQSQLTNQRTVMWSRDMSVHRLAVPLSEDHLRCDVLRGPEHLVAELPGLPVNVALVKIGGQTFCSGRSL